MKIHSSQKWAAVCISILAMTAALKSSADQMAAVTEPDKTYTGTISTVDTKERVLEIRVFVANKQFNLGDTCTYIIAGKGIGSIDDLRPGQRVMINYHTNSASVADCVKQGLKICDGMVTANDTERHVLTLYFSSKNNTFQITDDCRIVLNDGKSGAVADIQPGNHVTVTYEPRDGKNLAREIAQTSMTFAGRITVLNQTNRTVEAKTLLNLKEFHLADNCVIVDNGKTDGQLSNFKPGDSLKFNYNNLNGVNVASRIDGVTVENSTNDVNIVNSITNAPPTQSIKARSPRMQNMR